MCPTPVAAPTVTRGPKLFPFRVRVVFGKRPVGRGKYQGLFAGISEHRRQKHRPPDDRQRPFSVWLGLLRVKVVSDSGYTEGGVRRLPALLLGARKYMQNQASDQTTRRRMIGLGR